VHTATTPTISTVETVLPPLKPKGDSTTRARAPGSGRTLILALFDHILSFSAIALCIISGNVLVYLDYWRSENQTSTLCCCKSIGCSLLLR